MSDTTPETPVKRQILSNEQYNVLKWVALVALPALATLYGALAVIWELPKANEVVGTVIAIDTCLGLLLNVATKQYNNSDTKFDGVLHVDEQDHSLIHQLEITTTPYDLGQKDSIELKVQQVPTE